MKRGVPASPVRVLGANVLQGTPSGVPHKTLWREWGNAAAEAVLPEFKSKTA